MSDNDLDDPADPANEIAERAGGDGAVSAKVLQDWAKDAADRPAEISGMARVVLIEIGSTPEGEEAVRDAIGRAGAKQLVLSQTDLILISMLISAALSGYVVVRTGGRLKETGTETVTYGPDGKVKQVTRKNETVYLDPLGGLSRLLSSLMPKKMQAPADDASQT